MTPPTHSNHGETEMPRLIYVESNKTFYNLSEMTHAVTRADGTLALYFANNHSEIFGVKTGEIILGLLNEATDTRITSTTTVVIKPADAAPVV